MCMNEYLLLDFAADLGYELAVSGAETYRVEDSGRKTKNDDSLYGYRSATVFSSLIEHHIPVLTK